MRLNATLPEVEDASSLRSAMGPEGSGSESAAADIWPNTNAPDSASFCSW